MSDNFKHLGHHIGPAPTSEEMGLFYKPKPSEYDEPIAGGPKRWRQPDGTFKRDEPYENQKSGSDSAGTGQQEGAENISDQASTQRD